MDVALNIETQITQTLAVGKKFNFRFHTGKPIFHDGKKGWDCCPGAAYDWEEFQKIVGCAVGKHNDTKEEVQFWKSSTVSNAESAL